VSEQSKPTKPFIVALVGAPNCGKTTIFNALTGSYEDTGNWAGVTVAKLSKHINIADRHFEIIDIPGIYSLSSNASHSTDEKIASEFLLTGEYDLVVNVMDASNLSRGLVLTTQLTEAKVPMILALNMMDRARAHNISIDTIRLAALVGACVIPMTAHNNKGISDLQKRIVNTPIANKVCHLSSLHLRYPIIIEQAIADIIIHYRSYGLHLGRMQAVFLLKNSKDIFDKNTTLLLQRYNKALTQALGYPLVEAIRQERASFATRIMEAAVILLEKDNTSSHQHIKVKDRVLGLLDRVFLHRHGGPLIFFFMMYLTLVFSIGLGGVFQKPFELLASAIFIAAPQALFNTVGLSGGALNIIIEGLGGGIKTVISFVPVMACLYIALSLLETSGYMARAAFVMDSTMRRIGLSGKAFVPLIVGLGCNVPAITATRILEHRNDRIITIIMAPFMSCGARLSVYALFCAAFFPSSGQNIVFILYLVGIIVALLTGWLFRKLLPENHSSYLLIELPSYQLPSLRNIAKTTGRRLYSFVIGAGRLIVVAFFGLHLLSYFSFHGLAKGPQDSLLAEVGRSVTPAFKPMGISEDNWPAVVGIFTGVFAKEVVVGTLNALYTAQGESAPTESFFTLIKAAGTNLNEGFSELKHKIFHPPLLNLTEPQVDRDMLDGLTKNFHSRAAAFAYLLFILLYFPCISVFAAITQELGYKWAVTSALYSTFVAYIVASGFYQIAA
jgi:ferrous iron transport protein B